VGCVPALLLGGCTSAASPPSSPVSSSVSTANASGTTEALPSPTTSTAPPTILEPTSAGTFTTEPATGVEGLAGLVDDLIPRRESSGVVLVARNDEVVFEAVSGLANRDLSIANNMDTRFSLGSMNEMFAAVAVLQLMEQQLLTLAGTIAAYLPDYPNREVAEQVTIEQLLTHTSGLGGTVTEEFDADLHPSRTNADYLPLFVDDPLQFAPGQQFGYSNAGYVVLGLIIERPSRLSYDDYVRDSIFEPGGRLGTGSFDVEEAAIPPPGISSDSATPCSATGC
jgi:CubicO group peptidase (beta-lactamase class C family)